MDDVLLSAVAIYQLFASPMVLSAAAMVCSHCCQQTVSFSTISDFFVLFLGFLEGLFGHACLWCQISVPRALPPHLWSDLGSVLWWDVVGGPTWPCVTVVPDFGATRATSVCVGFWGGRLGHV